ncbi:Integrase catalytic core [Trinorchestia longiramus]|nr:Integrase catalytic core [Trinorchestia longiramus]
MPTDRHSPRESRHLSYISQFTTDLRYIKGSENTVADCLSRINCISIIPVLEQLTLESISDAQKEDPELRSLLQATQNSLRLVLANGVYCDADRPNRPYLPVTLRRAAIAHYHSLSHAGTDRTLHLIAERYVWPSMRKDVKHFVQHCHDCQSSKVTNHNRAALQACAFTGNKFDSVHLDLVGPLPTSRGYSYLLTMIDRFTRCVEAVPISDITSETVARTFVHSWIARFGVPLRITHDRGAQFASKLWADVSSLLGCANFSTTAFHPQSNGLIERVHRDLKTALKCLNSRTDWVDHLPMVLLSLRNLYKQDQKATTSEMLSLQKKLSVFLGPSLKKKNMRIEKESWSSVVQLGTELLLIDLENRCALHKINLMFLEQSPYTKALLSRFGMDKVNSVATPVDVNADLVTTSDEVEDCDKDLYQSAVGSLLY